MAGTFIVITGPSAAGKTEVTEALIQRLPKASRLITTTTTRAPRPGEGVTYFFVTRNEFEQGLAAGEFFEHAEVYGNLYGSSKKVLDDYRQTFAYVFAVIDVQGAQTLKSQIPEALVIFIKPGALADIKHRLLTARPGTPPDELQRRLAAAEHELTLADTFDLVVDNVEGQFNTTVATIIRQLPPVPTI